MAYINANRNQQIFFPPTIEEYIRFDDPARVYDAFIDALNFKELGIVMNGTKAGAQQYHPKMLMKIIVYGYLYGIRSSRKLERACHHNLSFIWLTADLKPDYRTILRFMKNNREAIKNVLKQCALICMKLGLIGGNSLFIDGSKFRANAGVGNSWNEEKCKEKLKQVEENIERIMKEAEELEKQESGLESIVKLDEKLLKEEKFKEKIKEILSIIEETGQTSLNTTDPESVKAKSRQGTHACFNGQISVDGKHGLILNAEVVNQNNDLNQLSNQISQSTEVLGKNPDNATSDAGYMSLPDIDKVPKDIVVIMPDRMQAQKENGKHELKQFSKEEFKYDKSRNEYICPEGKTLECKGTVSTGPRKTRYKASGKECRSCVNFGKCTKDKSGRTVVRMKEEELHERLKEVYNSPKGKEIYKLRKEKVELPFGHMKRNLGAGQFMTRGLKGVNAEFSILSSCFNLARMMTIIGIPELVFQLKAMQN